MRTPRLLRGLASVIWWAPTLGISLVRLAAVHGRFQAEMLAADVLYALRRDRAARRVLAACIRRNRRRLQAERRRCAR